MKVSRHVFALLLSLMIALALSLYVGHARAEIVSPPPISVS